MPACETCGRIDCSEHPMRQREAVTPREQEYYMASQAAVAHLDTGHVMLILDDAMAFEFDTAAELDQLLTVLREARQKAWPAS